MCKSMLYTLAGIVSLMSIGTAYSLAPHQAVDSHNKLRVELPAPNISLSPEHMDNLCAGILPVVNEQPDDDQAPTQECVATLLRSGITMNSQTPEIIQHAIFGVQNKRKGTRNQSSSATKPRISKYKGKPQDGAGR